MEQACIKGSGFESAVEDVKRLLERGRLDRDQLEVRLEAEDLAYLEDKILPSSWYPLASYDRFIRILLDLEGRGDPEYLVERGRRAADRLYRAGLYRQLEATVERWGERLGPLMASLGEAMFRGTRWKVEVYPDRPEGHAFHVDVDVTADFPDCARHTAAGFMEFLGSHASGVSQRVTSTRPSRTRVTYDGYRR